MKSYNRRLAALARQLGCPVHGALLSCPGCDVPEPLPEPLATGVGGFIDAVWARVGREGIRTILLRVPPPPMQRPCGRCGGPHQCGACQARYAQAVVGAITLTAEEQATLEALLADCRAREREGR